MNIYQLVRTLNTARLNAHDTPAAVAYSPAGTKRAAWHAHLSQPSATATLAPDAAWDFQWDGHDNDGTCNTHTHMHNDSNADAGVA